MGRSSVALLALLVAGCWVSHGSTEEEDAHDGATGTDGAGADTDAVRDDAAGAEATSDDGRESLDLDAPDTPCRDDDGDGHPAMDCGGDDCDDGNPAIHPGAPDACGDGLDTNCDDLDPVGDGLLGPKVLLVDTPATGGNMYTALLWTGREYLFVWRKIGLENISLIRLDVGGKRIGDEVPLRTFEYAFDTAWSGSRLGAAWSAADGGEDAVNVFFQAYDVEGRALTDTIRITDDGLGVTDGGVHFGPRIVGAGDDFVVAWQQRPGPDDFTPVVHLVRLTPEGTPRFAPVVLASLSGRYSSSQGLELVWTGREAGVLHGVVGGPRPPTSTELRLQRVDGTGAAVGPAYVVTDTAWYDTQCQFVWTGSEFAAFWNEEGDWPTSLDTLTMSRMDAAGEEIARAALGSSLRGLFPEQRPVAWADGVFGIVWAEHPDTGWQLTLRRFESSGALRGSGVVIPAEAQAGRLDIAWTGGEYGVIWSEELSDPSGLPSVRVYFQRVAFCDAV